MGIFESFLSDYPSQWIKVGSWETNYRIPGVPTNFLFYAFDDVSSEQLRSALDHFKGNLPHSVIQKIEQTN